MGAGEEQSSYRFGVVCLFLILERERESTSRGGEQGERESHTGSILHVEPDAGSISQAMGS